MANHALFVRYLAHPPIKMQTHFDEHGEARKRPLVDVADALVAATADASRRRRLGLPPDFGPLRLCLPQGVSRAAAGLDAACFLNDSDSDTALDPGCGLAGLVATSKQPLIINTTATAWTANHNDSALDLCTIHRSVQDRIWKSVVHISCDEFNGTGIVIDKTDSDLYILTNLHMLGTDKAVLSHVSAEFERECASLSLVMNLGHAAGKRRKRRQKDDTPSSDSEESSSYPDMSSSDRDAESSSDPIKIKLQRHTGAEGLEFVLKFVLEPATCWAASAKNDFMIFKVPVPNSCLLEKCALGANDLLPTLPVHIFGFPGILVSDSQLRHNYAIITAEITGKDERGHFLLSALSTLAGGFGSKTEQYQCYGYGLECVPDLLPRFLNNTTKK